MTTRSRQRAEQATATEGDPRWARVRARDPSADGAFVYSVATTGVYCRPSCPSRRARPEHVRFHLSGAEAEALGFRPCRRCAPGLPSLAARRADLVAGICRLLDDAESPPPLAELARRAGLSPHHFHRVFTSVTGLTPRGYAMAGRAKRMREGLGTARTVTAAVYDAGFASNGPFYRAADPVLGMTPGAYRAGGAGMVIRSAVGSCALGAVLVAATDRGVCAILLGDDPGALRRELRGLHPRATLVEPDPGFAALVARVIVAIDAHGSAGADLPLDLRGTIFQQRVWQALRTIPRGSTVTYGELARHLGAPGAARALARACATNRIAVLVPCHRVVGGDGSLTGYRWGLQRKRALLDREARNPARATDDRAGT